MAKKLLSFIMLSSFFFSVVVPAGHAEPPTENVIVVFKDDIDKKAVSNVDGEIIEVYNNIPVVTAEIPVSAISLLEKDKDVLTVEIDQRVQVNGQVQDWGIKSVNAPASWESQFTGKGIKVAVLDTGISPHDDLVVAGGVSFISNTASFYDDNGHGTHVAGIIGAENNKIGIVGVAPDADIYAVKVLDKSGTGYLSDIIKGIDWSITNNMDIINLSLGVSNESLALKQAVDKAYNRGILIVAAAGNNGKEDGSGDTVEYPARYESTIAVSATDPTNNRGSFSATGTTVEVTAPGVNIISTYIDNRYASMNGTSMAAPYVAGTLALFKQSNPTLTNSQLRDKLTETVIDLGVTGKDTLFGYGLVQAPIQAQETIITTQEPQLQPVKSIPKPIVKPIQKKTLTSSLSTYRSTYNVGNTIWINIKVVDKTTKKALKNGNVKLSITPPKGKEKVVTLKTNSKGEASYKIVVTKKMLKGKYKLKTTTSLTNYQVTTASKTITIK